MPLSLPTSDSRVRFWRVVVNGAQSRSTLRRISKAKSSIRSCIGHKYTCIRLWVRMPHCRVEELIPTGIFGPILGDHFHEWNAAESPRRVHSSRPTMSRLGTHFNIRLDPDKMSHRKILWSLEAARFVFKIMPSLWNLRGTSAAVLPRHLCQNFQNDART